MFVSKLDFDDGTQQKMKRREENSPILMNIGLTLSYLYGTPVENSIRIVDIRVHGDADLGGRQYWRRLRQLQHGMAVAA